MRQHSRNDIQARLRPVRRVLGGLRLLTSLEQGITAGAVTGAILLAIAHVVHFAWAPGLALLALAVGGLAGFVLGLDHWPTTMKAARVADTHFSLYDGLTTALEFESSREVLPALQRSDLQRRIEGVPLVQSHRGNLRPRDTLLMVLALGLATLLFVTPRVDPSSSVSAAPREDSARIATAARSGLPTAIRSINRGLTPEQKTDPAIRQLNIRLTLLRHMLLQAQTRAQALRDISLTQSQLEKAAQGLKPVSKSAIAQLNQALRHYFRQKGNLKQASSAANNAKALKNLAQSLTSLKNASQRNKLASQLEKAANNNKDRRLKKQLSKAAKSLANNSPKKASSALRKAAGLISQAPKVSKTRKKLLGASAQLDKLKNQLLGPQKARGLRPKLKGNSQPVGRKGGTGGGRSGGGKSGRGSSGLKGISHSTPQNQSVPLGKAGSVRGVIKSGKTSSNSAQAVTVKARKFGTGGVLGVNASTARTLGRFSTVYVPGTKGLGIELIQSGKSQGIPSGSLVPYRLVLVRYAKSAGIALNRVNLPPKLQAYVRNYFLAISQ